MSTFKHVFISIFLFFALPHFLWADEALPPYRIISLKPNITDILYSLGFGDQLVGVTTYCDLPQINKKIDKIADYVHVDVERVISKKPTHIFGSKENSLKKEIEFLKSQKFSVTLLPFDTLEETLHSIEEMASILGIPEKGREVSKKIRVDLSQIKKELENNVSDFQKKGFVMIVGMKPFVVVGGNNLINDLVSYLGLTNLAGSSKVRYPTFGIEQFILLEPRVLIVASMGTERSEKSQLLQIFQRFSSIPAVKENNIYELDVSDFRSSDRMVRGARQLANIFLKR